MQQNHGMLCLFQVREEKNNHISLAQVKYFLYKHDQRYNPYKMYLQIKKKTCEFTQHCIHI